MSGGAVDTSIQLGVIAVGYGLGSGGVALILRVVGAPVGFRASTMLIVTLPLVTTILAEWFTGLWLHTPGSLGLGGLSVFEPMVVAGAATTIAALIAERLLVPFDLRGLRKGDAAPVPWVAIAVVCSAVGFALWRFWPKPTPRLF